MREFHLNSRTEFEAWLSEVPTKIAALETILPPEVFASLSFSPDSLVTLVNWLLSTYDSLDSLELDPNWISLVDGIAAYIGEVHVRQLSWHWDIDLSDDFASARLPLVLDGVSRYRCPHSAVTSTVAFPDRRMVFGGEFYQLLRDSDS